LKRAFSAYLHGDYDSWGDAPGFYDAAPVALNRIGLQRTRSILIGQNIAHETKKSCRIKSDPAALSLRLILF